MGSAYVTQYNICLIMNFMYGYLTLLLLITVFDDNISMGSRIFDFSSVNKFMSFTEVNLCKAIRQHTCYCSY